jgi:cohesin complex subunit SA-1/2
VLAMRELVNFVLKCTGCGLTVETHDIEDVDNVPSKLGDLQDEYQQVKLAEYPLISKLKQFSGFRSVLTDFFSAVIKTMHESSTLYDDTALFENIQVWIDTMSSASIRPFRHTATVMSLTISTALCEIARDLQSGISTTRGQIETEKKKKSVNKGRVSSMQEKLKADEVKLEAVDTILKDEFDVVFVHRYRDVDPKVRVECVIALGNWIVIYRQMFLEGQYLRYLGWVLSDPAAQTRSEVVKVLKTLFKNPRNIAALRAFTDRFRPRMVEMAARDAEPGVRAETIELLDKLRDAELLEPDDIDTVGQLVFDAEPRVRKAVAKFFVSNIEDLYKANTEDLDKEQYEAALPKRNDDYLAPTQSWIRFKCLAQTLTSYDNDEDGPADPPDRPRDVLSAAELDSRYMLATQSIFPYMKELQEWESLAGYLLYDHSQITAGPDDADVTTAAQAVFKLNEGEETVLLEVLDYTVKLYLLQIAESHTDKKGKKSQASKDEIEEKQELVAHNLTLIIPQLLNKFGSTPQAATAILRLEHLLNIDFFNALHQTEATYSALLDDINKQFMSHSDRHVLAEASKALINGRRYEQSKEATDLKVQEMWDDALSTLQNLFRNQSIDTRGTLSSNVLTEVSNTVSRLSNLACVSDCVPILEGKFPPLATINKKQKPQTANLSPLTFLLRMAKRGEPDEDTTADFASVEDDLCTSVIKTLMFYFMWKTISLRSAITSGDVRHLTTEFFTNLDHYKNSFTEVLGLITAKRTPVDPVRLLGVSSVLDLYTLFSTLRSLKPEKGRVGLSDELETSVSTLITTITRELQVAVMQTHDRLEKSFARKSRRKLEEVSREEPGEDDAPIDSDDDEELDDEDGDDELEGGKGMKKQAVLLAEQRLCDVTGKIVLAVIGRVMVDGERVRERLMRNRFRLGPNYKEVVAYLEEKKPVKAKGVGELKDKKATPAGEPAEKKGQGRKEKSAAMVLEDDDIEDDGMEGGPQRSDEDDEEALRERGLVEDEEPTQLKGDAPPEVEGEEEDIIGD